MIDPSTTIPKSMAPRLIRLPLRPSAFIAVNATSMANGIAAATMSPPRMLPKSRKSTPITKSAPSARLMPTVRIVRFTRSERS
jgi:hypothetical protein